MSLITLPHAVFLYDEDGNAVPVVSGSAITSGSRGFIIFGEDGNGVTRQFQVDADGKLAIQDPANLDVALSTRLSETTFTSSINTLGQKNMAGSTPVVLASDQTSIPVTDNGSSLTIDNIFIDANISDLVTEATFTSSVGEVQATPTANTLLGRLKDINDTATTLLTELEFETRVGEVQTTPTANTLLGRLKDINDTTSTLLTELEFETRIGEVQATPTANTVLGRLKDINDTNSTLLTEADFDSRVNTLGQKAMTGSTPVVIASDQSEYPVVQGTSASLSGRWPVIHTDGTNTMPTLDSQTRAGFVKLTDGINNVVTVRTGSSLSTAADNSLVVQISPNQQPIPTQVVPQTATPGSSVGRASGLSLGTIVPVRQTTYVEQTTQAQRSIVSTDADDSSTGNGARQVRITYYNAACQGPFTELISLNGTTAVNTTATNICFIERMDVITVGSTGFNEGNINLYTGTGATGTIFAQIGVGNIASGLGDNETLYAHHYVAAGSKIRGYGVSVGIAAAAGGGDSVTVLRARNPTDLLSPLVVVSDFINAAQGNSTPRVYQVSIELEGPLVITAFTTPGKNNSTAFCSFDWSEQVM